MRLTAPLHALPPRPPPRPTAAPPPTAPPRCVLPALTLLYPIIGIGRVYTVVQETIAAIRVQRYYRYYRNYQQAYLRKGHDRAWREARRESVVRRPIARRALIPGDRTGTEVFAMHAFRSEEGELGCDGNCVWRLGRHGVRTLGMAGYILSTGLCFRQYGESDVEGQFETLLETLSDREEMYEVGKSSDVVQFFRDKRKKERAERAEKLARRFADRFEAWRLRALSPLKGSDATSTELM
jgi:hypothetical protein